MQGLFGIERVRCTVLLQAGLLRCLTGLQTLWSSLYLLDCNSQLATFI